MSGPDTSNLQAAALLDEPATARTHRTISFPPLFPLLKNLELPLILAVRWPSVAQATALKTPFVVAAMKAMRDGKGRQWAVA